MKVYACKITGPKGRRTAMVTTVDQPEHYLARSDLPTDRTASEIVEFTKLLQWEGQGVFRSRTSADEEWTLFWVELGRRTIEVDQ